MSLHFSRSKLLAIAASAFIGGVFFASSLDWTQGLFAQGGGKVKTETAAPLPAGAPSEGFSAIAERVTPAVVSIQAERDARRPRTNTPQRRNVPPGFEDFFNQLDPRNQGPSESSGSGFIVSKDGYILTNNHVVDGADRVKVLMSDRREFKAKIVGRDPQTDVAVLKIDGSNLPTVGLGDDQKLRIGEWVVAIGNPLGLNFTVTAGIISAKGRGNELAGLNRDQYAITDFIQTDAAINPGNSGGPLMNTRGEVIGINSAIASQTGFYSGYGFAIPITLAKTVMDDIVAHGRVRRAILGITINDVNAEDAAVAGLKQIVGAKVGGFSGEDSPARKAGLEPGDIIVRADGKDVDRVSTLQRLVRMHQPGETIDVDVVRYGEKKSFKIKLGEAPAEATQVASNDDRPAESGSVSETKLGISIEAITAEVAKDNNIEEQYRGLRVLSVDAAGPAADKLVRNDVIVKVIRPEPVTTIRTAADLQRVLSKLKDGDYVSLLVYAQTQQGPGTRVVNIRIGE
ncbi:MAG: Do family serine endopeptidase [Gemmatimonadaceae bacterium]|nr:Do family serine endopeptidase [Gemmatimonadaceae bacterium]